MSVKRRVGVAHFLQRTYEMLETQKLKHLIEWSAEGDCFYIKNAKDFANKVLPSYFRHRNFQSFLRQLNMYNFVKKRLKNGWNQFSHQYFKRDSKQLLSKVHRRNNADSSDQEIEEEQPEQNDIVQLGVIKEQIKQIFFTTSQLVIQQRLLSESLNVFRQKLIFQHIEETKQENFLNYALNAIAVEQMDSPKCSHTQLLGNPRMDPTSPQLFILS